MSDFNYVLKRSARKTISISIQSDNSIIVRCPQKTKIERVEQFLYEKREWIEKHLNKNGIVNNYFSDVINGKAVLVKGEQVPLSFGSRNSFSMQGVCLTSLNKIKKVYVDNLGEEFFDLLNSISEQTNLKYSKATFRDYKSRWGCCNTKKELSFNYKLLMLPKRIWVYVIVHELCHTKYMNHSAAFWNLVAAYLPDYKTSLKLIKRFSFVCAMYC